MKNIRKFALVSAGLAIVWLIADQANLFAAQRKETVAAGAPAMGRLVINRAPNLGPTIVGLKIDGRDVDKISYNRRYDAPIAAGPHVLTTWPVVSLDGARPVDMQVNIEAGKTYTFTARRLDIQVVLR
jgi:hypothetical protein